MFVWVAVAAGMAFGAEGQLPCAAELFRIGRSTNANVVLYEANADPVGTLDRARPLHPTWLMLAEDGRREELTGLEWSFAYGVDVRPAGTPDDAVVALKAEPRRPIAIRRWNGCLVAIAPIGGRDALLRTIYVQLGAGLLPESGRIELVGIDVESGMQLRETIAETR